MYERGLAGHPGGGCTKGSLCNLLHVYRNPNHIYQPVETTQHTPQREERRPSPESRRSHRHRERTPPSSSHRRSRERSASPFHRRKK
jgi:hypothetical protein